MHPAFFPYAGNSRSPLITINFQGIVLFSFSWANLPPLSGRDSPDLREDLRHAERKVRCAMDRSQMRQEIDMMLDQLPEEELSAVKQYLESLFSQGESATGFEMGQEVASLITPDHPAVMNLAAGMGISAEDFLGRLGEYERELLTSYIDSDDAGMLINLKRALGLPIFS
jgi:hypothetical protein